ncbi:hypothetical protein GCM10009092_19090 [Bowmanella denitrificans]|uniref:CAAX prenyl protease 2/Lysostaphin resistance protein A-like domain-containing protein n=2 Tax=Bowmanella denitrificans TaxID=366582 RepID=A0ABN0X4N0_9ALTE
MNRWLEMFCLFGLVPLLVAFFSAYSVKWLIPILLVIGFLCLWLLLNDPRFKRFRLWHLQGLGHCLRHQLLLFAPLALVISVLVYLWLPQFFLWLPSKDHQLWLLTLAIYPLVSVLPQELVFRTFFFHRYKHILPSKLGRLGLSTFSFALAHAAYGNWVAVVLSGVGGLLFGYRYIQTRSTLIVAIEHSLWGMFLFTIGLGVYLMQIEGIGLIN